MAANKLTGTETATRTQSRRDSMVGLLFRQRSCSQFAPERFDSSGRCGKLCCFPSRCGLAGLGYVRTRRCQVYSLRDRGQYDLAVGLRNQSIHQPTNQPTNQPTS